MSRSTQYIGLNDYAEAYLKEHAELQQDETPVITTGMFDEPVIGRVWKEVIHEEQPNRYHLYQEVLQDSPWSSGPMIFTHIRVTLVQPNTQAILCGFYFSWMVDPSLTDREYDAATGRYYV